MAKSQDEAQQALLQAQQMWGKLATEFAAKPAAPYDRDAAFAASVAEVGKVYDQALKEVNAGQLSTAHNTLERVRDIMADMRQRNNVVVFSDHMNAYHSQMEVIQVHGGETLAQPKGAAAPDGADGCLELSGQTARSAGSARTQEK